MSFVPEVRRIERVEHGALDYAELGRLGLDPAEVSDFSTNVNPYGPAPVVLRACREADVSAYPDRECLAFRRAVSRGCGLPPECVSAGNGSAELVDLLSRALLSAGDGVLVAGPTFGEYERSARLCGARVLSVWRDLTPEGFRLDVGETVRRVRRSRPRLVWLCDPNNPTGDYLGRAGVRRILEAVAEHGGTLVVDEAYRDLLLRGEPEDLTDLVPLGNLVLLRSMTKAQALAGLRLGYALASAKTVRAVERLRPPWSVSGPAQAAGIAALSPEAGQHVERSRRALLGSLRYLETELSRLGFGVLGSRTSFLLARVPAGWRAGDLRARLLSKGFLPRDCASFGLADHVRLAPRLPEECRGLVAALKRVLAETGAREARP